MTIIDNSNFMRAHVSLIRTRNFLWLSFVLFLTAMALAIAWEAAGLIVGAMATVSYLVALWHSRSTGNHLGQFGLKYPIACIAGSSALANLVTPIAGVIAPVAMFLWLKENVAIAYRNSSVAPTQPESGTGRKSTSEA